MSEEHVFDLLPGYAIGILDEEELIHVNEHLSHCDICRQEYVEHAETSSRLAFISTQHTPTPMLKTRVLEKVRRTSGYPGLNNTFPVSEKPIIRQNPGYFMKKPMVFALGLLSVLIIFFLAINNFILRQQLHEIQTQESGGYMQVVQLEGTSLAPQTSGYVMVFKNQNYGSLAVTHAPLLDEDQQYQIWLIQDGVRISGGVFSVNADGYGNLMVAANQPLDSFDSFGITIEPLGGSAQPTGEKVLGGKL